MNNILILIVFLATLAIILFAVLKRNRKDEKELEKSLDVSEDEEALRSNTHPGARKEL